MGSYRREVTLSIPQFHHKAGFTATAGDGTNPQGTVTALVGILYHILPVLQSVHALVVDHQDDHTLGHASLLHLAPLDVVDHQAILYGVRLLVLLGDRYQLHAEVIHINLLEYGSIAL